MVRYVRPPGQAFFKELILSQKATLHSAEFSSAFDDSPLLSSPLAAPSGFADAARLADAPRLADEWRDVSAGLKREIGDVAFRSWLNGIEIAGMSGGDVVLEAPSRVTRDWVKSHYADRILEIWSQKNPAVHAVEIKMGEPGTRAALTPVAAALPLVAGEPGPEAGISALDPRFTFENFVVGKSNELAHAAARRVAEAADVTDGLAVPFNPLFLYGGVGLGKTHLMHAIAWAIRKKNPKRKVMYLSAEKFMYEFVRALRFKDTVAFKEQFRSVDVLMIDDIQFICGKDSTQEEFFHTFNALVDQNRQIVISADKSPSDLEGMEERLRSRLGWGLVADLHPTTYELRLGILQAKADTLKAEVPLKVLEFLAHKIASNVRELEGALTRVVAHADLVARPVTIETTQEVLRDLLRANDRRITIDEIQRKVAEHFNIKVAEMFSDRRARIVARPRQVAMYLAKQLTTRSLPEIGRKFGGRDHTTVMHAVKKIDELMGLDQAFREDVELLRRALVG
jgi:chromosomal replication initiator protein